jgi:predicted lactoylglutathione lyase
MFDHVTLRATDLEASVRFYATVLPTLDIEQTHFGDLPEWDDFSIAAADDKRPATRGLHIGFVAPTTEHADAFWRAGVDAGYADDGAPGPRPEYGADYYGAFLTDPDGNSAEAVHMDEMRTGGNIDHLWVRVAGLSASRSFYETIAPHAGFRLDPEARDRAQFKGRSGSFSVLEGPEPTRNLHMAFPALEDATVDAFHRAATEAGHRDNGAPGERPEYHPGYYAAFVLDPDGNNVEVVNHRRA